METETENSSFNLGRGVTKTLAGIVLLLIIPSFIALLFGASVLLKLIFNKKSRGVLKRPITTIVLSVCPFLATWGLSAYVRSKDSSAFNW